MIGKSGILTLQCFFLFAAAALEMPIVAQVPDMQVYQLSVDRVAQLQVEGAAGDLPAEHPVGAEEVDILRDLYSFQEAGLKRLLSQSKDLTMAKMPSFQVPEFQFLQPPHTGTVTVLTGLALAAGCQGYRGNCPPLHTGDVLRLHQHWVTPARMGEKQWEDWTKKITFIMAKNPWSRVISCAGWLGAIDSAKSTLNRTADENIRSFREFVRENMKDGSKGQCHYLNNMIDYTHSIPPNETEPRQVVTFVGRALRFAHDFNHITDLLGLPNFDVNSIGGHCVSSCPSKNGDSATVTQQHAVHLNPGDFYDEETRAMVAHAWEKDIAAFGFVFPQ